MIIATIRVPSFFVLNRQPSSIILTTVSTPKVNELSIKDTFLLHKTQKILYSCEPQYATKVLYIF